MTSSHSKTMQDLQSRQAAKLTALHGGNPEAFVEVGCGDGSFMSHMERKVRRVLGIDPSHKFAVEARAAGHEVIEGYVLNGKMLTDEKFDLFAARQVLEHVADPLDVLQGILSMLRPGAVGLIEVPNGYRALRLGRFFEFFPDHAHYYSVNSLVGLATQAHLAVIECRETFGGDYLELWVRNDPDPEQAFRIMQDRRTSICRTLEQVVKKLTDVGTGPIALWGAGAKTLCLLTNMSMTALDMFLCVYDSDSHKSGLFVPNTKLQVVSPRCAEYKPRAIVILALSYREEIADQVRRQIPSCDRILSLDDNGGIVEL